MKMPENKDETLVRLRNIPRAGPLADTNKYHDGTGYRTTLSDNPERRRVQDEHLPSTGNKNYFVKRISPIPSVSPTVATAQCRHRASKRCPHQRYGTVRLQS